MQIVALPSWEREGDSHSILLALAVGRIQTVGEQHSMAGQRTKGEIEAMNRLYYGDNLDILRNRVADGTVDLCYIDPPFNSKRNYFQIYATAASS